MLQSNLYKAGCRLLVLSLLVAGLAITSAPQVFSAPADQPAQQAPAWTPNTAYAIGALVTYNGVVYRCIQAHTSLPGWEPPNVAALWQPAGGGGGGPTPTPTRTQPGPTPTRTPTSGGGGGTCQPAWNSATAYVGGSQVSRNGQNYRAAYWTQGNDPATSSGPAGSGQPWIPMGSCGGGGGGPTPTPTRTPTSGGGGGGFVVSRAQFDQMFPNRNPFYTYDGLIAARSSFPAFAGAGDDTTRRREAAAALANFSHETGGLVHIEEIARGEYCSPSAQWPCAPGKRYYGRGPIQLSWNFNYGAAGQALGLPLLTDPDRVARESAVAWQTALWYWMTQNGPGTMTPHNAMVNGAGFGETIRSINGSLECNGGNPAQVQSRINNYQRFTQILGVTPGNNLSC